MLPISCSTSPTVSKWRARPSTRLSPLCSFTLGRHVCCLLAEAVALSAACSPGTTAGIYSQEPALLFLPKPLRGQVGSCLSIYRLNRCLLFGHLTPVTEWSCSGSTWRCCALENTTPMLLVRPEKTSQPSLAFFPLLLKETDAHLEKITFSSEMYKAEKQKPTTVPRDNDHEQPPGLSADYRAWRSLSLVPISPFPSLPEQLPGILSPNTCPSFSPKASRTLHSH